MDIDTNIVNRLKSVNQSHLLSFWDQLDQEQRSILVQDIKSIDFDHVTNAFNDIKDQLTENELGQQLDHLMEPIPEEIISSVEQTPKNQLEHYRKLGFYRCHRRNHLTRTSFF